MFEESWVSQASRRKWAWVLKAFDGKRNVRKCSEENHGKGSIWGAFHKLLSQAKFRHAVVPKRQSDGPEQVNCRNHWSEVTWWGTENINVHRQLKRKASEILQGTFPKRVKKDVNEAVYELSSERWSAISLTLFRRRFAQMFLSRFLGDWNKGNQNAV